MPNILCFDTETTGLPHKNLPKDDPRQPWPIQIALDLFNTSHKESLYRVSKYVALPEGAKIEEGATKVHGISEEMIARSNPLTQNEMSDMMIECAGLADYVVGYNVPFDIGLIESAATRVYPERFDKDRTVFGRKPVVCIMRLATPICKIGPIKYGRYRWPKLEVAYELIMGTKMEGAHDAMIDVDATKELFHYFMRNELELK